MLSEASYHNMTVGRIPSVEGGIQPTIVDAKGDLIAAVAADSLNRLAVGSNDQVLVADSAASTGLAWKSYGAQVVAGKNGIINGGMDIWQRSTSATFAGTVIYPAADRWAAVSTGAAATCTMSRQTADTTSQTYGLRFGRNSGQTNTGAPYIATAIESQQSRLYAGQTVTLSFYAKAGANAPLTLTTLLRTGTGTDQTVATMFSTGWTGGVNVDTNHTVTTTMARYSVTTTLGSTVNEILIGFGYSPTGTAGANEWFQIEGVQLEIGSVATPFSRAGGTIQGELAACQRYYYVQATGIDKALFTSDNNSSTLIEGVVYFPVSMRIAPSAVIVTGTNYYRSRRSNTNFNTLTIYGATNTCAMMYNDAVTGLTAAQADVVITNNASSSVAYNAEL
jgi:hypothetical protein